MCRQPRIRRGLADAQHSVLKPVGCSDGLSGRYAPELMELAVRLDKSGGACPQGRSEGRISRRIHCSCVSACTEFMGASLCSAVNGSGYVNLRVAALLISDNDAAQQMNEAKRQLFKTIFGQGRKIRMMR